MVQAAAHENKVLPKVTAEPFAVKDAAFPNADSRPGMIGWSCLDVDGLVVVLSNYVVLQ